MFRDTEEKRLPPYIATMEVLSGFKDLKSSQVLHLLKLKYHWLSSLTTPSQSVIDELKLLAVSIEAWSFNIRFPAFYSLAMDTYAQALEKNPDVAWFLGKCCDQLIEEPFFPNAEWYKAVPDIINTSEDKVFQNFISNAFHYNQTKFCSPNPNETALLVARNGYERAKLRILTADLSN